MNDSTPITIRQALDRAAGQLAAAGSGFAVREAELLLAHALTCERERFFREPEQLLGDEEHQHFRKMVARRVTGEPLQHITGVQEFWSIEFRVDGRALIPRPETEHLVEAALERIPADADTALLDICTGSGIVAAVLARECPRATVTATDISPRALALAAENFRRLGLGERVRIFCGDLFEPLGSLRPIWNLITANPPYISEAELAELEQEVRGHEPLAALDGGPTGTAVIQRIIEGAVDLLRPGGWLLMEVGAGQWGSVEKLARAAGGWGEPCWVYDLAGYRRVLCLPLTASRDFHQRPQNPVD